MLLLMNERITNPEKRSNFRFCHISHSTTHILYASCIPFTFFFNTHFIMIFMSTSNEEKKLCACLSSFGFLMLWINPKTENLLKSACIRFEEFTKKKLAACLIDRYSIYHHIYFIFSPQKPTGNWSIIEWSTPLIP